MITQTHDLNLIPGSVPPVVNVTQFDKTARTLVFNLWDGETSFSVPSGAVVTIRGTKPDGNGFEYAASMTGNTVKMDLQQQMATCAGSVRCEVRITSGTQILGTADFILEVKPSALNENTPLSETELPLIEEAGQHAAEALVSRNEAADYAKKAADSAAAAAASASSSAEAASAAITAEVQRAKDAEADLNTKIGDNSAAITAEVQRAKDAEADLNTKINKLYPVGSIYMSTVSTSPASLFGGTWEQIKDRFLLAAGDTYAAGSTGGEAQHALTKSEMPKHTHPLFVTSNDQQTDYRNAIKGESYQWTQNYNVTLASIDNTGNSQPHNNMPPYLAVYMWKRIA